MLAGILCGQTKKKKMNPLECVAFNGQTTLCFHNGTDLHCVHSVVQNSKLGKSEELFVLLAPGPLSNVKWEYLQNIVGEVQTQNYTAAKFLHHIIIIFSKQGSISQILFCLFVYILLYNKLPWDVIFLSVENIIITAQHFNTKSYLKTLELQVLIMLQISIFKIKPLTCSSELLKWNNHIFSHHLVMRVLLVMVMETTVWWLWVFYQTFLCLFCCDVCHQVRRSIHKWMLAVSLF